MENLYFLPISKIDGLVHTDQPFISNTVVALYHKGKNCVVIRDTHANILETIVDFLVYLDLVQPHPIVLYTDNFHIDTWDLVLRKHGVPLQGNRLDIPDYVPPVPVQPSVNTQTENPGPYRTIKRTTQEEHSPAEAIRSLNDHSLMLCSPNDATVILELTSEYLIRSELKIYFFKPIT